MNEQQFGIVFHKDRCIQCLGCESACRLWRAVEQGNRWRRVLNIWHGAYPTISCVPLSLSCQHCAEPACVDACPSQAITKRHADGVVLVDGEKCTGCGACLDACPFDAPQFGADGLMRKCDMCTTSDPDISGAAAPPCVRTCPTGALEMRRMTSAEKKESEKATLALYREANE